MNENRPFIVTFIGDLYFLGGLLSIVAILFPNLVKRFGFYVIPCPTFLIAVAKILLPLIVLLISYGYLKLKGWGYFLMLIYNMSFLIAGVISLAQHKPLFFSQNIIATLIQLIFILPTRKYFVKNSIT